MPPTRNDDAILTMLKSMDAHLTTLDGKLDGLREDFTTHLLSHAKDQGEEDGVEAGRSQVLGFGRNAITMVATVAGIAGGVISVFGDALLSALHIHA